MQKNFGEKLRTESCGKRGCSGCVELDVDAQDALDKDVDVDDVGVELVHVVERRARCGC